MNCDEHKIQINLFMDDELGKENQIELFKHLSECNDCRNFLDLMVKCRNVIKSEKIHVPTEIDDYVFEEISNRRKVYSLPSKTKEKTSFWNMKFSIRAPLAAAILLILILTGFYFINGINQKYEMLEAQQAMYYKNLNSLNNIPVKYIMVTEMPEIEVVGYPRTPKKVNSAIYNK